jgi:hypothetical protein
MPLLLHQAMTPWKGPMEERRRLKYDSNGNRISPTSFASRHSIYSSVTLVRWPNEPRYSPTLENTNRLACCISSLVIGLFGAVIVTRVLDRTDSKTTNEDRAR